MAIRRVCAGRVPGELLTDTQLRSALDVSAGLFPRRRQCRRLRSAHRSDRGSGVLKNNLQSSSLAFQLSFNACNLQHSALPCTPYLTASQHHLPKGLRNTYYGNWQPRIAIAYRPFNDTKTVIRAGFGVFTRTNLGPLSVNNSGNPRSNLHTYTNSTVTDAAGTHPLIQFPNTAPPNVGVQYGGGGLDQGVDRAIATRSRNSGT
jgi:hypothetical protein